MISSIPVDNNSESSKNNAITRIGTMLTNGWKLLNDVCPLCHTSLLSKGDELRCPRCDLPIVVEKNCKQENVLEGFEEKDLEGLEGLEEYEDEDDDEYEFHSLEETKRDYDSRHSAKSSASSGRLAEKLLGGWVIVIIIIIVIIMLLL